MITYQAVKCMMDGQAGWSVERATLYGPPTVVQHFWDQEYAEAEADRLNGLEQTLEAHHAGQ